MEIILGKPEDQVVVETILVEATRRIQQTGSSQWATILTGSEKEIIATKLAQGEVYLAVKGGKNIGVFYLSPEAGEWDQNLWQAYPTTGKTYYLHKLALGDEFVGQGRAGEILNLVQAMFSNTEEKITIRLDCIRTQEYLNMLYPRSGFELIGTIGEIDTGTGKAEFNLYQWQSED